MTGSRGLSRRSSQGAASRRSRGVVRGESCVFAVAEGGGFRFGGFGDASESGGKASAGVERGLERDAGGGVPLGGEPLASGAFVLFVGFGGRGARREEHQGGDAADEHCGENESDAEQQLQDGSAHAGDHGSVSHRERLGGAGSLRGGAWPGGCDV